MVTSATVTGITLTNTATSEVLELDKVTTEAYVLESVFWSAIQGQHHSYKYLGQTGETVTDTTLETRDVTIVGWVIARSDVEMANRKRLLNRFFNPQQPLYMVYDGYNLTFRPDTTVSYAEETVDNNDVVCKFKVVGYANDPLWRSNESSADVSATTLGYFRFPLVLPNPEEPPEYNTFGVRRSSFFVYVENNGDLDNGLEITFYCDSQVTNPRLVNANTLEYFGLNKQLHVNERVVVDTNIGHRTVRGFVDGEEQNYFKYRNFGSTWLQVGRGVTRFKLEADANVEGLDVIVRQVDKYLEVQQCI